MRLTVIIVNYKTPGLVLDCLASLFKYDTTDVEIFVADNNSGDNMETLLQQSPYKVNFLQMGYNAGFARANNAVIRLAKGEHILLLNSDTVNIDDAVNRCDSMLRESAYVAGGVQLLNEDGSPQITGNFAVTGGLNYLLPLPFVGAFLKWVGELFKVKKPSIKSAKGPEEVDWINGAFLMVKAEAIKQAGLINEDFFLYSEEAEWCSRLRRYGRLCIFGQLNIYHLQGASSNDAFASGGKGYFNLFDRKGLQIMLSNFVRIRKEFGVGWFLVNFFIYFFTIPVMFLGVLFTALFFPKTRKYTFSSFRGFMLNMFRLLKFLPPIISNRPHFYKVL